jgi:hypothetical protein
VCRGEKKERGGRRHRDIQLELGRALASGGISRWLGSSGDGVSMESFEVKGSGEDGDDGVVWLARTCVTANTNTSGTMGMNFKRREHEKET